MYNKVFRIKYSVFENRFNIIAVTEGWFKDEIWLRYRWRDMNFIKVEKQRGGGVALYINSNLKCKLVEADRFFKGCR